jgi:hypothetical protein
LGQAHLHHLSRQWSDNKQSDILTVNKIIVGMVGYGVMKSMLELK